MVGTAVFLYLRLDNEIQKVIQRRLAKHYSHLAVHLDGARLIQGQGIRMHGLSIVDPSKRGPGAELIQIEEILIVCNTQWRSLISQNLDARQIIVRGARTRLQADSRGAWNVSRLLPLPKFSRRSPRVVVQSAMVEYVPPRSGGATQGNTWPEPLALGELELVLAPRSDSPPAGQQGLAVTGSFRGAYVDQARVQGTVHPRAGRCELSGTAHGLRLDSRLGRVLPPACDVHLPETFKLQAAGTARFRVTYDTNADPAVRFGVDCDVRQGRLSHPTLGGALDNLKAAIRIDSDGIHVSRLSASHGASRVQFRCRRTGWGPDAVFTARVEAPSLYIDQKRLTAVSQQCAKVGRDFQPAGPLSLNADVKYDGRRWTRDIHLQLNGLSLRYHRFPYPLRGAQGQLRVTNNTCVTDIVATAQKRPITIRGRIENPGARATGWMHIEGHDVPIDEQFLDALPDKARRFLATLHPTARADVRWTWEKTQPDAPRPHDNLVAKIRAGAVQYDRFRYPLSDIQGTIQGNARLWRITDLVGIHGSGTVVVNGSLGAGDPYPVVDLAIQGSRIALDDALRDALPSRARHFWHEIRPEGEVDVTVQLRGSGRQPHADLTAIMRPVANRVSIYPRFAPYRLDRMSGTLKYASQKLDIEEVAGWHRNTKVMVSGFVECAVGKPWYADLGRFRVERLVADEDTLAALPPGLRSILKRAGPGGRMDIDGALRFRQTKDPAMPVRAGWDITCDLEDKRFDWAGLAIDDATGKVHATGQSRGPRDWSTTGRLELDTLVIKNLRINDVHGPFLADPGRVLLGAFAGKGRRTKIQRITGRSLNGNLVADGWTTTDKKPRFSVQIGIVGADLNRLPTASLPGQQPLQGFLDGGLSLEGFVGSAATLNGRGHAELRHADMYELPLIVALLKVLSARLPNTTAFTTCQLQYRIHGRRVYFDKLNLLGDAVNLYGRGTMDFRRNVQLAFHANFRESDLPLPVVRRLLGEASKQILQIYVEGTFEDPVIREQPFPWMNQAWQQIQADLGRPPPGAPRLMDLRQWFNGGPLRRR